MITKSDKQLNEEVLWELKWDSRINEAEVDLEVSSGIVTLTGTVDSFGKKMAAQEAAHKVHGVLDVANDIQVKIPNAYNLTDTEIAQAVRNAIKWDVWVPENIQSTVSDGWVTLKGTVEFLRERDYAERSVRNLRGVRGLSNNVIVLTTAPERAEEIKALIEAALGRRAEHEANRIKVEVHDGTVVLAGKVNSWPEKQAVLGTVSYAPGVKEVQDNLCIVAN
jgi:osmotically-inducible protein OsmY